MDKTFVKYGLYYGLTSVIIALISFYIYPIGIFTQMALGFAIMIVFFILGAKEEARLNNNVLSYGDALKTTFLIGVIGVIISVIFSMLMMKVIDPTLQDVLKERMIESTASMMEKLGVPDETVAETVEKAEADFEKSMETSNILLSSLTNSIFVLIIAAIVSIFVKKEEAVA